MNYNHYDISNKLEQTEQEKKINYLEQFCKNKIIELNNDINDMKKMYNDKLNYLEQLYENKIKELKEGIMDEQTYILEPIVNKETISYFNNSLKYVDNGGHWKEELIKKYNIEPLIITLKNNVVHLYGGLIMNAKYKIPSNIKTNSHNPRLLYNLVLSIEGHTNNHTIILHNNILSAVCSRKTIYGYNQFLNPIFNISNYLTIDIHFNL
jgi:hypothetical protein